MLAWLVKLVALEVALIKVEMFAMLQTKIGPTGKNQREIRISMAMALRHTATEERHR